MDGLRELKLGNLSAGINAFGGTKVNNSASRYSFLLNSRLFDEANPCSLGTDTLRFQTVLTRLSRLAVTQSGNTAPDGVFVRTFQCQILSTSHSLNLFMFFNWLSQ